MLGLADIPVLMSPYASADSVDNLTKLYDSVGLGGTSLVVVGCLGSIVAFAAANAVIFREKTQVVVHIGGAHVKRECQAEDNADGCFFVPDPDVQSNRLDMTA